MKQNETAEVEILPSMDSILRRGIDERTLNRLVQQKVAEIMAERDAVVFEPFFRSRQIAYELKRLQTMPEQRKWTVYFDRYGCLICETRKRIHVGNGMCTQCYNRTFRTLQQIIAEGINGKPAHAARGVKWEQRLLPETSLRDGVHHTYYDPSDAQDRALYKRVATKLGVSYNHVRAVARGKQQSESVSDALKKEAKRSRSSQP